MVCVPRGGRCLLPHLLDLTFRDLRLGWGPAAAWLRTNVTTQPDIMGMLAAAEAAASREEEGCAASAVTPAATPRVEEVQKKEKDDAGEDVKKDAGEDAEEEEAPGPEPEPAVMAALSQLTALVDWEEVLEAVGSLHCPSPLLWWLWKAPVYWRLVGAAGNWQDWGPILRAPPPPEQDEGAMWQCAFGAAAAGRREIVRALWPAGRGCICTAAAMTGRVDMLRWLRTHYLSASWGSVCSAAIACGHLNVLRWACEQPRPHVRIQVNAYSEAYQQDHVHILRWLEERFPPATWSPKVLACAAADGQLGLLSRARGLPEPPPWDKTLCEAAAETGKLEALVNWAAGNGYQEVLLWASELPQAQQAGVWDVLACDYAAAFGHLEVLRWLREQKQPPCPWNPAACVAMAAARRHRPIVEWVMEQVQGVLPDTEFSLGEAALEAGLLQ